ncbi:ARM repeat-containing protein [Morchella conica CCBAS932]|uniref:ARM repeat-containing protein n=1 Tax=Morchella conica CCBAS932 TaxID=1392247 RepID=A0A3N4KRJ9_9PEZI|nr:ARM repeat-containing protein [Morchella conica CCBAS932]
MAWQPQEGPILELAGYLKDSLGNSYDSNAQKRATEMLQQATSQSPDINNYLCYILVHPNAVGDMSQTDAHVVRSAAALLLKNNIANSGPALLPGIVSYIKSELLLGLRDPHAQIRNLTGTVITTLLNVGGIMSWTDVLTQLIALVDNSTGDASLGTQEGAMGALLKVCQDSKKQLDKEYEGQRPLNFLIPKFIQFTQHPVAKVRADALDVINIFLPIKSQSVLVHVDSLLESLFRLSNDSDKDVRKEVCRALVHLVDIRPDKIAPHMEGIVDYMLSQQKLIHEQELALDAAEFWLTVGEHEQLRVGLGPYLDKIVPVLLQSMVYAKEDIIRLGGGGDDADQEDKVEDIRPTFAKNKQRLPNGESVEVGDAEKKANGKTPGEVALDELSDGELDDDYDSEDDAYLGTEDPEDRWNLRKCSAAALDVLATVFHQSVFETILPYLKENLRHPEWPYREAAVLALGAVADGCLEGVIPHLPELIPYLISLLDDGEPLVRQITCWTLGRYSRWASHLPDPADKQKYFEPMMGGILTKMLDGNKRVQEAGASAFANLEEQSKELLKPYIEPIVRQFVVAMGKYKDRNMFILYDCIQTLAEHVGHALAEQSLVDILMPALIDRWKKVKDDSRELFPLLECLSYVATALGHSFTPYAGPIFYRCIGIIHQNLQLQMAHDPLMDNPDKDFLVTSLDLLSALIQALDSTSAELVAGSRPSFFELLTVCMADVSNDVRQSAYALLGDCAIYVFQQLHAFLPSIMELLIQQLDIELLDEASLDTGFSVVNNACWSCGEIALQQGPGMGPYVERLYNRLVKIIQTTDIPTSVTENAAVALGRLGLGSCDELAPHLESFAYPFLDALQKVAETDEKDSALRGFCLVVGRNPEAMESCLVPFFRAIARYKGASAELNELFLQTLLGYKRFIADFDAFMSQIPPQDRESLRAKYAL